jgi:hypothetical protein
MRMSMKISLSWNVAPCLAITAPFHIVYNSIILLSFDDADN